MYYGCYVIGIVKYRISTHYIMPVIKIQLHLLAFFTFQGALDRTAGNRGICAVYDTPAAMP